MKHLLSVLLSFLFIFFLGESAFADGTWTNYIDSHQIRGMALQGNYLWCATNDGIIRWDIRDMSRKVYTTADGLLENDSYSVAVKPDGTVWATTKVFLSTNNFTSHLMNFDGTRWKLQLEKDGQCSIGSIDVSGNIWIIGSSVNGISFVSCFDGADLVLQNPPIDFYYREYPTYMKTSPDGTVWIGSFRAAFEIFYGQFCRYDGKEWTVYVRYFGNVRPYPKHYAPVLADPNGIVWFWTDDGDVPRLVRYDGKDRTDFPAANTHLSGKVSSGEMAPDGTCWFGTDAGEMCRYDGSTWKVYTPASGSLFSSRVKQIEIGPDGAVWVGTDKGLSRYAPPEPSAVQDIPGIPAGYSITGNAPNPFNPSTTISYTLPAESPAELSVYSITGQKVRTLLSGRMEAGAHTAVWDGRDDAGKTVSSGVYLAHLRAGSTVSSHKMLLMK